MDTNKKILIIDDEPDLAQLVGFQFRSKGFDVQTAGDGLEGLKLVHDFHPDLIILDINMARMGGIEFYGKLCGSGGKPPYPILVLTARANIKGLFEDLKIDGFMIKPFDIDELVCEAEMIIRKKDQEILQRTHEAARRNRKVCIAGSDPKEFEQVAGLFLNADYTVLPARNGQQAIEKIMNELPDVALVHLGLVDIPGDTTILRLSQMSKLVKVKLVLYTGRNGQHDPQIMERLGAKSGIWTFVQYNDPRELLEEVNKIF